MAAAVVSLSCFMDSARAETSTVALSLANAAPSPVVMKSGPSDAMASMRTAAARRYTMASAAPVYDRRVRANRDPFLLILGVAY